jgi:2-polyprenyl-3-methyl-5-hydroxy-6-metoxy-1,4-benzoquinol methylase
VTRQGGYRERLFRSYDSFASELEPSEDDRLAWFAEYVSRCYLPYLANLNRETASLLDIGCSRGYALAALAAVGFKNVHGIDFSPGDLAIARRVVPDAELECVGALDYLPRRAEAFDVVLMKAVLEHTPKVEVVPLLEAIAGALKPGGLALIDVPNMDWLFASHERYLDFTHESGFTSESLRQVAMTAFETVEVEPLDNVPVRGFGRRRAGRFVLGTLLRWSDPEGGSGPIWARSLLAIARSAKTEGGQHVPAAMDAIPRR